MRQNTNLFWFESAYHNVVPLVELEREVPVGLDPLGVGGIHNGLAGGSDGYGLRQLAVTRPRHPGHLPTGIAYYINLMEQLAVIAIPIRINTILYFPNKLRIFIMTNIICHFWLAPTTGFKNPSEPNSAPASYEKVKIYIFNHDSPYEKCKKVFFSKSVKK